VQVLGKLAGLVRPDTGRIILIEHGKGWWKIINNILNSTAESHFHKFGCWWNRDIEQILQEATRQYPGLDVIKLERPYILQFGTTYCVELRVKSDHKYAP
jgi:methyltransferase OMS1